MTDVNDINELVTRLQQRLRLLEDERDVLMRTDEGWRITAATFHPAWGRGNQQIMITAAATTAADAEARA